MATPHYRLVLKAGGEVGTVYPLETDEVYVGRDEANDIVIHDAEVSRRHARLRRQGNSFVIEDMGSTNGTFIGGKRISTPFLLRSGAEIGLGPDVVLVFEQIADPDATVVASMPTMESAPASPARPAPSPRPARRTQKSGASMIWVYIAVLVVLFIGAVAAILLYIDANNLWCTVFPFLFPGAC